MKSSPQSFFFLPWGRGRWREEKRKDTIKLNYQVWLHEGNTLDPACCVGSIHSLFQQKGLEPLPLPSTSGRNWKVTDSFFFLLAVLRLSSYTVNWWVSGGSQGRGRMRSPDQQLSSCPWHRLRRWSGLRQGLLSYCKEKASSKCSDSQALTAGLRDLTVKTSGILPSLFLINHWDDNTHFSKK